MVIGAEDALVVPRVLRRMQPMLRLILCQRDMRASAQSRSCGAGYAPSQPARAVSGTRGGLAGAVRLLSSCNASTWQHLRRVPIWIRFKAVQPVSVY